MLVTQLPHNLVTHIEFTSIITLQLLNFYLKQKYFFLVDQKQISFIQQVQLKECVQLIFLRDVVSVLQKQLFTKKRVKLVRTGKVLKQLFISLMYKIIMFKFLQKMLRRTLMSFLSYSSWQVIHIHIYQTIYYLSAAIVLLLLFSMFI